MGQTQEQRNYTLSVLSDTFDTTAADLGKHGNHLAAALKCLSIFKFSVCSLMSVEVNEDSICLYTFNQ